MEILVTEGGEHIRDMLNAVAAFTGAGPFESLLRLLVLAGLVLAAIHLLMRQTGGMLVQWGVVFVGVMGLTLVPKSTVIVVDKSNPGLTGNVIANVPMGLAYLASLSTTMGDTITHEFETVMGIPNTVNYSNNGMMWGHSILSQMPTMTLPSKIDQANVNEYLRTCVFPVAGANPIAVDEITTNTDLWAYFNSGASVTRLVTYTTKAGVSSMMTCQAASGIINTDLDAAVSSTPPAGGGTAPIDGLTYYGKRLFSGLTDAEAKTRFEGDLSVAHNEFLGVSRTGAGALKQLFVINQVKSGMSNYAAQAGAPDLMNYVNARAETQSRLTMASIGRMMQTSIPRMYSVLLVLLIAIFPIVLAIAMLPGTGFGIIKNYAYSFVYLQFWPVLFVIFNRIIQVETANQAASAAASSNGGIAGLSLDTIGPLASIPNETAAMAGVFLSLVPVLAGIFTKGIGVIGGQMESVLRPQHVAAESAAGEAATGNINMGNTQMNTHGFNQMQGNTLDTSGSVSQGEFQRNTGSGGLAGYKADGTAYADATRAISSGMEGVNASAGIQRNLSQASTQANEALAGANSSYSAASAKSNSQILGLMAAERGGLDVSSIAGEERGNTVSDSFSKANGFVENLLEQHGLSYSGSSSASGQIGVKGNAGFEFLGTGGGAYIDVNTGKEASKSKVDSFFNDSNVQRSLNSNSDLTAAKRAFSGNNETSSFGKSNEFTKGLNESVNDEFSSQNAVTEAQSQVDRVEKAQSIVESQGGSINANLGQWQFEEIEDRVRAGNPTLSDSQVSDRASDIMTATSNDDFGQWAGRERSSAAQAVIQQYTDSILGGELVGSNIGDRVPERNQSQYRPEEVSEGYGRNEGEWKAAARQNSLAYRGDRPAHAETQSNAISAGHTNVLNSSIEHPNGAKTSFSALGGFNTSGEKPPTYEERSQEQQYNQKESLTSRIADELEQAKQNQAGNGINGARGRQPYVEPRFQQGYG